MRVGRNRDQCPHRGNAPSKERAGNQWTSPRDAPRATSRLTGCPWSWRAWRIVATGAPKVAPAGAATSVAWRSTPETVTPMRRLGTSTEKLTRLPATRQFAERGGLSYGTELAGNGRGDEAEWDKSRNAIPGCTCGRPATVIFAGGRCCT